jgi:hypothetical protein
MTISNGPEVCKPYNSVLPADSSEIGSTMCATPQYDPFELDGRTIIDCTKRPQITDGTVLCTAFCVSGDPADRRLSFILGERMHVFYEFTVLEHIEGRLFVGVDVLDRDGIIVHGKNSLQFARPFSFAGKRGTYIQIRQCFDLRVSPGLYRINLALASSERVEEYLSGKISYAMMSASSREHCRVVQACSIEVEFPADGRLPYHGIADLPGEASARQCQGTTQKFLRPPTNNAITLFHVTHWRAGSQWIHRILRQCAPERIVAPEMREAQVRYCPIQAGHLYPSVYLSKPDFDALRVPQESRKFVVIRDLRDTLISAYFGFKTGHPILDKSHIHLRERLGSDQMDSGLLYLMDHFLPACAQIQLTWLEAGAKVLKYEELLEDDTSLLEEVLIDRCELPIERRRLREIILANRFEVLAKGRRRGVEDPTAHERKGIVGDWRNYLTGNVKAAFKARFGGLLVASGYEKDLEW